MHLLDLYFVLYLLALFCFLVAVFAKYQPKVNLVALGLAFAIAVPMIQTLHRL